MNEERLRKEISIQIDLLDATIREICLLRDDLSCREPTLREVAAAGSFLADFYGGIENILKRICIARGVEVPAGEKWHRRLFQLFCETGTASLPVLIDNTLHEPLGMFRGFRHIVHHGYVFQLRWSRMAEGVQSADQVYEAFKQNLRKNNLIE